MIYPKLVGQFQHDTEVNTVSFSIWAGLMALLAGVTRFEASEDDIVSLCKTFVRNSDIPAAIVDKGGHVVICNNPLESFLGRTQAQLQRLEFKDFTHPAYVKEDLLYFEKVFSPTVDFDNYKLWKIWVKPDGKDARGTLEVYPLIIDDEVVYVLAIIHPDKPQKSTSVPPAVHQSIKSDNAIVQALQVFSSVKNKGVLLLVIVTFIFALAFSVFVASNGAEILELLGRLAGETAQEPTP